MHTGVIFFLLRGRRRPRASRRGSAPSSRGLPARGGTGRAVSGGTAALFLGNFGLAWRSPIGCQLPWKRGWHGSAETRRSRWLAPAGGFQAAPGPEEANGLRAPSSRRAPGRAPGLGRTGAVPRWCHPQVACPQGRVGRPRGLSPCCGLHAWTRPGRAAPASALRPWGWSRRPSGRVVNQKPPPGPKTGCFSPSCSVSVKSARPCTGVTSAGGHARGIFGVPRHRPPAVAHGAAGSPDSHVLVASKAPRPAPQGALGRDTAARGRARCPPKPAGEAPGRRRGAESPPAGEARAGRNLIRAKAGVVMRRLQTAGPERLLLLGRKVLGLGRRRTRRFGRF